MVAKILKGAGQLMLAFLCGVGCTAVYVALDHIMGDELTQQQSHYCSMVQINKDSNGERGWPDYNGNAAEVCDGQN